MSPSVSMVGREQAALNIQQQMMSVVHRMKEIPELPSEKPKDVSQLTQVQFPEEGGVLTYMENHEYPYRGFPFYEMVEKIDTIKKIIRSTFSSFFHTTKSRNRLQLLLIIFVPWLVNDAIKATVYSLYRIVERFRIKKDMYCQAMRELRRAFGDNGEFLGQLRDLICMVLEFDNAYRFRFQDIIVELDKGALKKHPTKEIHRLLTIMQSREKEHTVKDTWTLFKWAIPVFLFLNRGMKKQIVSILSEIDIGKAALTPEDKWYCYPRKDYTFGFQLYPTKEDKVLIDKVKENMEREEKKLKIREESTNAHEELFSRQNSEMKMDEETDTRIRQEIDDVQKQIYDEAGVKFNEERKKIFPKYLTEEQYTLLQKHDREIQELDEHYNERLKHAST